MTDVKMEDAYYLETILESTGSVIIIANDLLSFLLEIVSVAVRWVLFIILYF